MDAIKAFFKQLAGFWNALPTQKRMAFVVLTCVSVLAILLGTLWSSHITYATLYSNLEPQDAASIVEKLKAQQIPYRIEGDGRTIAVQADKVPGLRLELASGGLPRGGGVGFELFDRSQLGATEFEQQVSLRRALEGEITRSILTISGIESARVHLVMPERRLFVAKESTASASVVVKLRNPGSFSKQEVAGIVHLVSAAVPGLGRDRVSIVSTDGITLHRPETSGDAGGVGDEAALERASGIATQLENSARSQLERVVGAGNAEVRIAVDLDTAAREMVEEHYEPSKTALRSENRTEERTGAGAPGVAGVPGALTNLPDAPPGALDGEEAAGAGVARLSQTRNWEVDKVSQKTTTPAGRIARLSVSVLLNDRVEQQGGKPVTLQRSPQELTKLEELVKRSVGFNLDRGDSLKVDSAPFLKLDAPPTSTDKGPAAIRQWLPLILGGAGALVVLALLVMVWRRGGNASVGAARGSRAVTASAVRQMATGQRAESAMLGGEASAPALPDSQTVDAPLRRARAVQAASEDPATAAVVIRKWLNTSAGTPNAARL
jgi:flagellar M-ring protein FliF